MASHSDLEGEVALNAILQHCAPAIAKEWNGQYERVAMIVQRKAAEQPGTIAARVGFVPREKAVAQLRQLAASPGTLSASSLLEMATLLEQGPRERKVQCAVIGWNGSTVVELEPDDLCAMRPALN